MARSATEADMEPKATHELPDPQRWRALALLCGAFFMVILDATIVIIALPSIGADLHFSGRTLQWVLSLCTHVRRPVVARRPGGRPARTSTCVHGRCCVVHCRVAGMRARLVAGGTAGGPCGAGRRHGDHDADRAVDHGDNVHRPRWGDARTILVFAGSALLLVAFVVIESRHRVPLVPLRIVRSRTLVGTNSVLLFVATVAVRHAVRPHALRAAGARLLGAEVRPQFGRARDCGHGGRDRRPGRGPRPACAWSRRQARC